MRRLVLILPLLAACQPRPSTWVLYPPARDCGAAALQGLTGQALSALPATGPWGALRVIRPGDAVTEDFSESRLNVSLDGADRIIALTCG